MLEGSGEWIGVKALAARLGVPTGGDSFVKFSKALSGLADEGYLERQERQGVRGALRRKLSADLAPMLPLVVNPMCGISTSAPAWAIAWASCSVKT